MCSSWNCPTTSAIRSTHILAKIRWKSPRDRVGGGFRSLLLDNFPRRETPAFPSICTTAIFQFTSPRRDELGKSTIMSPQGDERLRYNSVTNHVNFNSRLRKETNNFVGLFYALFHISTHVSVRRRTYLAPQQLADYFASLLISTHVSARRRTGNYTIEDLTGVFQFTSPQGNEHLILLFVLSANNFNSRLRKETNNTGYLPP